MSSGSRTPLKHTSHFIRGCVPAVGTEGGDESKSSVCHSAVAAVTNYNDSRWCDIKVKQAAWDGLLHIDL